MQTILLHKILLDNQSLQLRNAPKKIIQAYIQGKTWFIAKEYDVVNNEKGLLFYFYPFLIKRLLYRKYNGNRFMIKWHMAKINKKRKYNGNRFMIKWHMAKINKKRNSYEKTIGKPL